MELQYLEDSPADDTLCTRAKEILRIINTTIDDKNLKETSELESLCSSEHLCCARQHSELLEQLKPNFRKHVMVLRGIQRIHNIIRAKFCKKIAELEAKLQKEYYHALYNMRSKIVNGEFDKVGTTAGKGEADEDSVSIPCFEFKISEQCLNIRSLAVKACVPDFWLNAMKTNEVLSTKIRWWDEDPLKYLKNIVCSMENTTSAGNPLKYLKDTRCCMIDASKEFKLDFHFRPNPYFKNETLTKVYYLIGDDEPILKKVRGSVIIWNMDSEIDKERLKRGSKVWSRPTYYHESFFNFFESVDYSSLKDEYNLKKDEKLQNKLDKDYDVGSTIRDKIIPNAVAWFTGEAADVEYCKDSSMGGGGKLMEILATKYLNGELKKSLDKISNMGSVEEMEHELLHLLNGNITPWDSHQCSEVLGKLEPVVKKHVKILRVIQIIHNSIKSAFFENRASHEAKCQKDYETLYNKRRDIVSKTGVTKDAEVVSVPDFWLNAMKANEVIKREITERDGGPLKYLKDIRWGKIDTSKGFYLEFFFRDGNPYFKNKSLKKTYYGIFKEDLSLVEKIEGDKIEWNHRRNVTEHEVVKRRHGSMQAQFCESFFNFFNDYLEDEKAAEELQEKMAQDYVVGSIIRDKIVPHAVSWFTGEATWLFSFKKRRITHGQVNCKGQEEEALECVEG